ncbi:hypothetical protein [Novacetimonas cocois]|uniref:Uncharacterized protein n=1 Tax=Novacetimonas cocois TaxID=1747507 RepID=A0A365YRD0_9PROT|nr:hypothetical protein [Novacetimonas cocois]RBM05119.1 hypothetical protein NJLHNGOC_14315 [Novacetimonas cocois]
MLDIRTYDARTGGNIAYKAFSHPLAAERLAALVRRFQAEGPIAIYDPAGHARTLLALLPGDIPIEGIYVHDSLKIGEHIAQQHVARPLTALPQAQVRAVWALDFERERVCARLRDILPAEMEIFTLSDIRLPDDMLTVRNTYLDRLNFAVNHAFFRDADGLSTRVVTTNYWARYGAGSVRLWLRLFDEDGRPLATWTEGPFAPDQSIVLESGAIRRRFGLDAFVGQLFIHVLDVAGHDVVKYALEIQGTGARDTLSVTHDANAWPAQCYANLPAPREGEKVILWVQNSHAVSIPAGTMGLNRMGRGSRFSIDWAVGPYETVGLCINDCLPDMRWPGQLEFHSGQHVVRPRYEIRSGGSNRIAHLNVERADLVADPHIAHLPPEFFGRGYLLPFPVPDPARYITTVQPTPMSQALGTMPVRIDCFDQEGRQAGSRFLGCLARDHDVAQDLSAITGQAGHGELVYDFRDGGEADGWLHALIRYEDRQTGHVAETSFGAHIFNTVMTYRNEPQSYSGPPPGLTTRLFLQAGAGYPPCFCHLIYPVSGTWHAASRTLLVLHDETGCRLDEKQISIPARGSVTLWPHRIFGTDAIERAGSGGYVMIRDTSCRLFGYHGRMQEDGTFSLDHMFGF